jgi:hypothetical protein
VNACTLGGPGFSVIPAADAAGISSPAMALGALSEDQDRGDLNESIGCDVAPAGASYTKTWTALMPVTSYGCAAPGPRYRCCPPPRDRGRLDRRADRGRIRQDPRARAHGYRVLPALPPGRPRGTAPWLDPALAGCRGARLLAPSATLEVALKTWSGVLSETSSAARRVEPRPWPRTCPLSRRHRAP